MRRPSGPLLPLRPRAPVIAGSEWVGGRFPSPFWVMQPVPYRPDLTIWLELPSGLLVATAVNDPAAPETSFADGLRAAMLQPAVGSPRSPERVRVNDPARAAELIAAFGDTLSVTVAPTPELDDVVQRMAESTADDEDPGYLEKEAFALFEPEAPAGPRAARAGRNDPCPCGSGRKYKKCHLPLDDADRAATPDPLADLDERIVLTIWRWAVDHHPEVGVALDVFEDAAASEQLAIPWLVFHTSLGGRPVVESYLARRGHSLSAPARACVDVHRAAWLGVWEVLAVEPGLITARDLLSGVVRMIREVSGSRVLVARDTVLGRVVTHEGTSTFGGVHHRPLPPHHAAEVVRLARGRLRRKTDIPVDRLRDEPFTSYLIARWEDEVVAMDEARLIPPDLRNVDGDPIVVTRDIFKIAPDAEERVAGCLAALKDVTPADADAGRRCFEFGADGGDTTIGIALLSPGELVLESNSIPRADALRRTVEAACGGELSHETREATDAADLLAALGTKAPPPRVESSPEVQTLLLNVKARHYNGWVDQPLPALGGSTPREAMATRAGRAAVDLLLKDMENHEGRLPAAERFDMRQLRVRLGLDA